MTRTVNGNDAGQAEIDGRGEEGRADCETNYVYNEVVEVEDVEMEQDLTGVASYLEEKATDHADQKAPCPTLYAEVDLNDRDPLSQE